MVSVENHIGEITVSENYLTELVKHTVSGCFGVADVCCSGMLDNAIAVLTGEKLREKHKGIAIRTDKNGELIIDLHIKVTFGTNITAAVKSITHKVGFTVEETIGTAVNQVNVFVDGMTY